MQCGCVSDGTIVSELDPHLLDFDRRLLRWSTALGPLPRMLPHERRAYRMLLRLSIDDFTSTRWHYTTTAN